MASTFGSFEAAKSGLSVAMQQYNVTEQNISNVNTDGYTRQRILTSAKEPTSATYLIAQLSKTNIGQGVETKGIEQIRSTYLDQQYRNLNTGYTSSSTSSETLKYLEGLFDELDDNSSLSISINSFFSALNTFSSDTSSDSNRTNVQQQAKSMTESFRNVYEEMQSLRKNQNDNIKTTAQTINSLSQQIASINDLIARSEQTVGTATDLNDERNLLLDKLSGYVNITYSPNAANGSMVDVKIGGQTLVNGKTSNQLSVNSLSDLGGQIAQLNKDIANAGGVATVIAAKQAAIATIVTQMQSFSTATITTQANTANADRIDVLYNGVSLVTDQTVASAETVAGGNVSTLADLSRNNLTVAGGTKPLSIEKGTITGGQLYSNMIMVTSTDAGNPGIPFYMDQLNNLVRSMAQSINDIHQTGYTYPDGSTASKNDVIFFAVTPKLDGFGNPIVSGGYTQYDYSKLTAGAFDISNAIVKSIYNIAGSSSSVNLSSPTPDTGNNVIALKLSKDLDNNGYYDKLNSIVDNLAITSKTAGNVTDTKESLLKSVDTQRHSISAVSLDEETTNLIIFQQAYNAATRVITTLDDMLNRMINNMGTTGT